MKVVDVQLLYKNNFYTTNILNIHVNVIYRTSICISDKR